MLIALKLAAVAGILGFFGWTVARRILGEVRSWVAAGLAPIIGLAGFVVLSNALGYLMPIRTAFASALVLLAACAVACTRLPPPALDPKWPRSLLIAACLLTLFGGIAGLRTTGTEMDFGADPLVATIVQGNFPVVEPVAPDHLFAYHYGSELFVAGMHVLAGLPYSYGYDISVFCAFWTIFLLAAAFTAEWSEGTWTPLAGGLAALLGGGSSWIHGFGLLRDIFSKFILHRAVAAPFTGFYLMSWNDQETVAVSSMIPQQQSPGFGYPALFALLFLFSRFWKKGVRPAQGLIAVMLLAYLALTMETSFLLFWFSLALAAVVLLIRGELSATDLKRFAAPVAVIALASATVAAFQGGILAVFRNSIQHAASIAWNAPGWMAGSWNAADQYQVRLWSPMSITGFAVALGLFVWGAALLRRRGSVGMTWIACLGTLAFLIPILLIFSEDRFQLNRLYPTALACFIWVAAWRYSEEGHRRPFVAAALASAGFSAALFLATYAIFPFGMIGRFDQPLIAPSLPHRASAADEGLYAWVRADTSLRDRFFPLDLEFVAQTGRYTPGDVPSGSLEKAKIADYDRLLHDCDGRATSSIGLTYAVVRTPAMGAWAARCAVPLGLTPVFVGSDGREVLKFPH